MNVSTPLTKTSSPVAPTTEVRQTLNVNVQPLLHLRPHSQCLLPYMRVYIRSCCRYYHHRLYQLYFAVLSLYVMFSSSATCRGLCCWSEKARWCWPKGIVSRV